MPRKTMHIQFPAAGVVRRLGLSARVDSRGPFPSPWCVNARLEDPLDRRLRGGSRPGLTKLIDDDTGTTIADMKAIQIASASGTQEVLGVLVDSMFGVLADGAFTVGQSAPATAFLVAGQQYLYAISSSEIAKLDPKTGNSEALAASAGTLPAGPTLGAVYRDRLFLAGADNAIYSSAMGDYTNWDTSVDSSRSTRALPPFQLAGATEVGNLPTALVPFRDSFLLAATARSLWAVRGDPGAAGSLTEVSQRVGFLDSRAWCKAEDTIVFLGQDGLYACGPEGGNLVNLSEERLPVELRDVDPSTTTILMGYDLDWHGLHIYLSGETDWFFHLPTKTFWPMALPTTQSPLAVCEYQGELLLGGTDGYIRKIFGSTDDGTAISSHVAIGPFRIGSPDSFGRLLHLYGATASGSADVTWRLILGDSAEEAADNAKTAIDLAVAGSDFSSYVHSSGTWTAGINHRAYPRARARWVVLWLAAAGAWSYESVSIETVTSGMWR